MVSDDTQTQENTKTLKQGDKAVDVTEATKKYLIAEALGFCCNPQCENRLYSMNANIGDCAHIVPESVGFIREDWKTPLEDRRNKNNLIYLCKICHKIIDTKENENIYTKEALLIWKSDHIKWAESVTKNSSHLNHEQKKIIGEKLSNVTDISSSSFQLIQQLLEICKNLVHNNKLEEASIILGQITALNAFADNKKIQENITILNARIAIKDEKIDFAKSCLLNLLKKNPDNIEALYRYIDICSSTPEIGDEKDKYLSYFQTKRPDHPKHQYWEVAEYLKTPKDNSVLDKYPIPDMSKIDTEFQEDFYSAYCIFLYRNHLIEDANKLFEAWHKNFPSSNIILFKEFFCKTENAIWFNPKNNPDTQIINDVLNFANQHKETVFSNLSHRQKIIWDYCEFTLKINLFGITGSNPPPIEDVNRLFDSFLECYFDESIDFSLTDILSEVGVESQRIQELAQKIIESNYVPSKNLINTVFIRAFKNPDLTEIIPKLFEKTGRDELINLQSAIETLNKKEVLENLNNLNDNFLSIAIVNIIDNQKMKLFLLEKFQWHKSYQTTVQFNILKVHIDNDNQKLVTKFISNLPLDDANYFALEKISNYLWENKKWLLFNLITKKMLQVITDDKHKAHLIVMLAQSYYHIGDYAQFEENALKSVNENSHFLGRNIENSVTLLMDYYVTVKKQEKHKVKELYESYKNTDRQPIFFLMASKNLLSIQEYDTSEEALLKALYKEKRYTKEIFHDTFFVSNELNNLEKHQVNLQTVTERVFVKLNSLNDWFYIGSDDYALGAVSCEINDNNYHALINKKIGDTIQRPANKYNTNLNEVIEHIFSPIQYINHKGFEAINHFAGVGKHGASSVTVINENGDFDIKRLEAVMADMHESENEFLDEFVSKPYPFAVLCKRFGGLAKAMSKIYQEQRGYIQCNDGIISSYNKHKDISKDVINGTVFYADALSVLMFIEADLLDDVINNCEGFKATPAVIKELSNTLNNFRYSPNTKMRMSYAQNRLLLSQEQNSSSFMNKLQDAITKLNSRLPDESILASASVNSADNDIEDMIPNYFLEPFKVSREDNALLLTDDFNLYPVLGLLKYDKLPTCFSSISLIWSMWNQELIDTKKYLRYFFHISNYRYHHLNITFDDIHKAIFPVKNGIYSYSLENMDWFNLNITWSSPK